MGDGYSFREMSAGVNKGCLVAVLTGNAVQGTGERGGGEDGGGKEGGGKQL